MSLTVKDLLKLEVLKEAQVLVGGEGLSNRVSFVDVIEVPDIAEWSKPETVYLTTAYPFSQDSTIFAKTLLSFVENGVSAIFIKLGRFIETIPPEVFKIANEHKFPIIILPTNTVYSPIITAVAQKIYEQEETQVTSREYSLQQKQNTEKYARLEQAFLEGIIEQDDGDFSDAEAYISKIDWDCDNLQVFVVINFERKNNYSSDRQKFEQDVQTIAHLLENWLKKENIRAIVTKKNDNLICLLNLNKNKSEPILWLVERLNHFQKKIEQAFINLILSIGISKKKIGFQGLNKSYQDAQKAVRIGKRAYGRGLIYDFEKMGVYKLLFSHEHPESLKEFYEDYLAPLVQYDQKHGSDLVNTLELYCANDSNVLSTAGQIYIHRNTLNYRLKRASEILGFDLNEVENKQCLALALKIKKLLNY